MPSSCGCRSAPTSTSCCRGGGVTARRAEAGWQVLPPWGRGGAGAGGPGGSVVPGLRGRNGDSARVVEPRTLLSCSSRLRFRAWRGPRGSRARRGRGWIRAPRGTESGTARPRLGLGLGSRCSSGVRSSSLGTSGDVGTAEEGLVCLALAAVLNF